MKYQILELTFKLKIVRELSTGKQLSPKEVLCFEIVGIQETNLLLQVPEIFAEIGNRFHLELGINEGQREKLIFSTKAKIIKSDSNDSSSSYLTTLELSQFNQQHWEEVLKLLKKRQQQAMDLFNLLKGVA